MNTAYARSEKEKLFFFDTVVVYRKIPYEPIAPFYFVRAWKDCCCKWHYQFYRVCPETGQRIPEEYDCTKQIGIVYCDCCCCSTVCEIKMCCDHSGMYYACVFTRCPQCEMEKLARTYFAELSEKNK